MIDLLRMKEGVRSVTIDSTLGKHPIMSHEQFLTDISHTDGHVLMNGSNRGKALLICNKIDREQWEYQHEHAKYILEKQFQLEVSNISDNSILNYINTLFSELSTVHVLKVQLNFVQQNLVLGSKGTSQTCGNIFPKKKSYFKLTSVGDRTF